MDFNNKQIAFFLVLTVLISIFGTFFSIQKIDSLKKGMIEKSSSTLGFASSDSGNVSLIIQKQASIFFVNSSCNWGSGYAEANTYCVMETNGSGWINSSACNGFSTVSECTILENNGSARVNVTLNFSNNETIFGPKETVQGIFQYNVTNYEADSCTNFGTPILNGSDMWSDINWTAGEEIICANLSTGDTEDTIRIDWKVGFNNAVTQATLTTNITATAESIEG